MDFNIGFPAQYKTSTSGHRVSPKNLRASCYLKPVLLFMNTTDMQHVSITIGRQECWTPLCLCLPFCISERCLDSNPQNCRNKQASYTNLATHLHISYPSPSQPPISRLASHLPLIISHFKPSISLLSHPSSTQPPISLLSHASPTQPPISNLATHLPLLLLLYMLYSTVDDPRYCELLFQALFFSQFNRKIHRCIDVQEILQHIGTVPDTLYFNCGAFYCCNGQSVLHVSNKLVCQPGLGVGRKCPFIFAKMRNFANLKAMLRKYGTGAAKLRNLRLLPQQFQQSCTNKFSRVRK